MRWVILGSLGLAILAWYSASTGSAEGSVGVCPSLRNSTVGPIKGSNALSANCTCVELRMPGQVTSISEVIQEDSQQLGRLIFDLI